MTAEPKIDRRTKEGRALAAKEKPTQPPEPLEQTDPYTKDWTEGFSLVKDGKALPADANAAMQEGGRAAQQSPAVIAQAKAAMAQPLNENKYAGYEVTRGAAADDHSAPTSDEWESPTRDSARQQPVPVQAPVPAPFVPAVFRPEAPAVPTSGYHERRARDVIRMAQERAAKQTAIATEFLQYPGSASKRAAFMEFCESLTEVPDAPPTTPYGDRDETYMYWLADWKPEEFTKKFKTCAAKLAQSLLKEIANR